MINYFLDNFLFKYPLKEWNVSDFKDRTNNCCKSLNGDLKRYFGVGIKDYRNNIEKFEKNICLYIKQRKSLDETRKVRKNLEVEIKDIIIQHLIENEKNIDVKALAHILLMFSKKGDYNTIIGELLKLSVKYFSMKGEKEMNQELEVDDDEYEKVEGYEWNKKCQYWV